MSGRKKAAEVLGLTLPNTVARILHRWPDMVSKPGEPAAAERNLRNVLSIATKFDDEIAAIDADPDLTAIGKSKAIARASQQARGALKAFQTANPMRANAKGIEARVLSLGQIQKPTDLAERLAFELRQAEVRADFRRLEPLARLRLYLETSDLFMLDAIETAPLVIESGPGGAVALRPLIDQARVSEARVARARDVADPKDVDMLERMGELADAYEDAVSVVLAVIVEHDTTAAIVAPPTPDQRIAAQARLAAGTATEQDLVVLNR